MSLFLKLHGRYMSTEIHSISSKANQSWQLMEVGAGIQVSPNMLRLFDRESAFCQKNIHAKPVQGGESRT